MNTTITVPIVPWIIKPLLLMRHPVLTPFGLRPHSVSTGNYTKTLSLRLVQQMGYSQLFTAFYEVSPVSFGCLEAVQVLMPNHPTPWWQLTFNGGFTTSDFQYPSTGNLEHILANQKDQPGTTVQVAAVKNMIDIRQIFFRTIAHDVTN